MSVEAQAFQALLDYLHLTRGFDFSSYKPSSITRRIQKRMQLVGIENYEDYIDYLEVHPDEFGHLFNMILINVTGFFRDSDAWEFVSETVLPTILAAHAEGQPIRIWSAGCASGEEAYTIAMVMAEAMGMEQFRDRVKIYATDLDEEALNYARQASYGPKEVAGVPEELLEKYFEMSGHRYAFHRELRRAVIFGRHDLIEDAPIPRIDLLVCRNVLMYFNSEIQARVLGRFHFALDDSGYLFLGKAEMLFTHGNLFTPTELKRRIFSKVMKGSGRDRILIMTHGRAVESELPVVDHAHVRDAAFQSDPLAQIIVDTDGILVLANERARELFNVGHGDMGRPLRDIELSYRPVELRSCIDLACKERRSVVLKSVEWVVPAERRYLDVQVIPLFDNGQDLIGVKVIFGDVTRFKNLQDELQVSKHELEMAYEELQSSNEELVTTNEELQSTVEELETTNEELQATNEELETMNEELQSTNEELQTINEELRQRGDQLKQVNSFLESILASLNAGVVVVDQNLHITVWNYMSEDLWGLRPAEVHDKHLFGLDIGLPVENLKPLVRACLAGERWPHELVIPSMNRRGKAFQCKVTGTPLIGAGDVVHGIILLMEDYPSSEKPARELEIEG